MNGHSLLDPTDNFIPRHIGPRASDLQEMLTVIGVGSLDELVDRSIPASIRMEGRMMLSEPLTESQALADLASLADHNRVFRSYIGMGYYGTITPRVVQRNILENPGWYTQYTPYQAEIAQGRLEALLNFQTMVADLTGMEIANASMLDESTAAAEAMTMAQRLMPRNSDANVFFISEKCFPQTIAVVRTRAEPLGIEVVVGDHRTYDFAAPTCGVLVQYPDAEGEVGRFDEFFAAAHEAGRRLAHQGAHESFWPDGVVYARWYSTCASSAGMRTHTPSAASSSDQREVARAHQ
jgi:glycine dehydrogenase